MPLLKPAAKNDKEQLRVTLDKDMIQKIEQYCQWAGLKKIDDFVEQAADFVFKKDKEWLKYSKNG